MLKRAIDRVNARIKHKFDVLEPALLGIQNHSGKKFRCASVSMML